MDNSQLRRLRRAHTVGHITGRELRRLVLDAAQKLPKVDIHAAMGDELGLIEDAGLRDFMYDLLRRVPRYYWHIPASIMGLHDIGSDNLMGGLVRHSRKVARVAQRIGEPYGLDRAADELVVAGILHDAWKYGETGQVPPDHDHATFAAHWLEANNVFADRPQIRNMVRAHLGRWGKVTPKSDLEWAFHLADFVVSRGAVPAMNVVRYQVMIPGHGHHRRE